MSEYSAVARLEGRWWVVEVPPVGVTQGRNLTEAKAMAVDLVTAMTGDTNPVVRMDVALPENLKSAIIKVRRAATDAEARQRAAARSTRELTADLKAAGLTGKDVAFVLGVSEQRVSQLLKQ